ncbi:MAG: methyltransferase domain-containing protein [Ottowia sp.]|uniref:methyltransferase domain-containing protein n=1 Tax=Ottowia sp. TaxID=1898956 RepID=UPI003C76BB19
MHAVPAVSFVEFGHGSPGPACPLCQHPESAEWVRTRHLQKQDEWVPFWQCQKCACLFSDVRVNAYAGGFGPELVKFYAEIGTGVEPIAQMVMENLPMQLRAFADVGCGLGYSLDFVEQALGVPAWGFEPNPMPMTTNLRGTLLPLPLDQAWLSRNTRRFDLLLACEVIEHLDDPVGFAAHMRAAMADEFSVAVFSTPDSASITPQELPSEVCSRLFPGEHRHLFTGAMLRDVLLRAGFESVEVVSRGGHLVASAGTESALARRRRPPAYPEPWGEAYIGYLKAAFNEPDRSRREQDVPPSILSGHAYRLLKALVNSNDIEAARAWRDQASPLAAWLDSNGLPSPAAITRALSLADFKSYVTQMPSFFGALSYHLAMLARLEGRVAVAEEGLRHALRLMQHEARISPSSFIESTSLLEPARMELALAAFSLGHEEQAFSHWQAMGQDLPHIRFFARASARLMLEANARANYSLLARILEILEQHPLRWDGLIQALSEGVWDHCPPEDFDLVFDVWIARFHSALHAHQSLAKAQEAYLVLSLHAERHPDPLRQAKLNRIREDLDERQTHERLMSPQASTLVHFVDQLWCDLHGVFVRGWVHAGDHEIRTVHLACAGRTERAVLHPRPDVVKFYPQYPRSGDGGFSVYLPCPPFHPVELYVDVGLPLPLKVGLRVPPHLRQSEETQPTASARCMETFRDTMKRRGGTVVVVGGRMGPDHPDTWADCLLPECRVVRVDIHPGPGVDLVADAHALSQHFAPGSVDAVISAYVMEHLEAPWVVAAEINRMLRPGGLTMHHAPHSWPLHAAPNDFWRFSDAGLRTLFGPATGFEVLEAGLDAPTRMHPPVGMRSTRYSSIEMPVFDGYLTAYVLASKRTDLPENSIRWPGTDAERIARAQTYPVGD